MEVKVGSLSELASACAARHPRDVLALAFETFPDRVALGFSGAEDVILIHMAAEVARNGASGRRFDYAHGSTTLTALSTSKGRAEPVEARPFRVFTLDTGRLHAETYGFLERVRAHFNIPIEVYFPQAGAVEKLVREKGLFSFYRDGHQECCAIRKVEPLRRALSTVDAWVTGQRRDQSPSTRAGIPVVQLDPTLSSPERQLVKFNPLADWSLQQVWDYIRVHQLPFNPLHERGFISIGCEPCTRPVHPGQHEREGRWWWEDQTMKECGLHSRPSS